MWLKYCFIVTLLGFVRAKTDVKSSLTFVIDDTGSMAGDIAQVKINTNLVFDAVLHSNESQIDNFILITFNDPGTKVLTITRDRAKFKNALASINVDGGGDCPEYSLSGIDLALEVSHAASYIYVFTDASAKDYRMLEKVQSMAVKQQSQVVFLLTGYCTSLETEPEYAAYYTLSKATDGKVFHMNKSNVGQVLKYIADSIASRKPILLQKNLPPGRHEIIYPVDGTVNDTTIAVAGHGTDEVKVDVYEPSGTKAKTEPIVDIPSTKILKITDTEKGNYTVKVDSKGASTLTCTGKTSFDFRHGFSVLKPSTLDATSTRPIAGVTSNILVQLETPDEDILLKFVDIVDLDDNVIMNFDVKILNETAKTYFVERFVPPSEQFKITIIAHHLRDGEVIRRYSKPIEPQKPELIIALPKSPTAEILEGYSVVATYKEPLQLTCKVNAYPQPTVLWEHIETGLQLPSAFSVVEPPYEYVSTLDIPAVETNGTYKCKASTNGVEVTKVVAVTVDIFFEVIETPKDSYNIPFNEKAGISCKVNAYPPADITWSFEGKKIEEDEDIGISVDTLTIKHMRPGMIGRYTCDIQNKYNRKVTNFDVHITGFERPHINKEVSSVSILQGSDATLPCRLLAGIPSPTIRWIYFPKNSDGNVELKNIDTIIHLKNVEESQAGIFQCEASNVAGSDHHNIKLNVEYPPKIKKDVKSVNARDGSSFTLPCLAKGNPKPHVTWTFNNNIVLPDRDHHVYRDHSLRIKSSAESSGTYTCKARNRHGVDTKTIDVHYVVPVSINIPARSTFDTLVGRDLVLECNVNGYPRPTIEWTFRSLDPVIRPRILKADSRGSLSLKHLQLYDDGFYTCNARNIDGATNITYQVNVNSPPEIVDAEKKTIYRAVEGDLVLRIPCKAIGKPKPVITWSLNGFNIAKGTEWNDIEEDGTLVIKNVDLKSRAYHSCKATNYLGSDQKYFLVDVSRYPNEEAPKSTVLLKQGDSAVVNCSVPQDIGSKLRWYKNGALLADGDLVIDKASAEHSGVYTCRVSNFVSSKSESIEVIVASSPEFETELETAIEFVEDSYIELDCTSYAEPAAKTEWYYNGNKIDVDTDIHYFNMLYTNIGEYTCIVSNEIGSINRTFSIKPLGCALHIQNDFTGNLPLMYIPYDQSVNTVGDFMYIPKNLPLELSCPSRFTKIPHSKITVTCKEDKQFLANGDIHDFSDMKCTTERIPKIIKSGFRCGSANTEKVDVGFVTGGRFTRVYEVCVDKINNVPVFTKVILHRTLSGLSPKEPKRFSNTYLPFDFETMYNCERQNVEISRILNRWFREHDRCCFGKRLLVSPKDVMPGLSQVATYNDLNVISQWSTCNAENWEDVEERIRAIAKTTSKNLLLWTGQAQLLHLRDSEHHDVNITINDRSDIQQSVPKYLWKIIQDPSARASLAIISVNIPDLTPEEARRHILCTDICHRIPWMNGGSWSDVTKGYTYCCRVRDFENAFGFRDMFSRGGDNVLTDVSYISTISLT